MNQRPHYPRRSRIDIESDPDFQAFAETVRGHLVPQLERSELVVSVVPKGETDVKFAVELGVAIMMDKPIVAVVRPGTQVPEKLIRVADRILEADLDSDGGTSDLLDRLSAYLEERVNQGYAS